MHGKPESTTSRMQRPARFSTAEIVFCYCWFLPAQETFSPYASSTLQQWNALR